MDISLKRCLTRAPSPEFLVFLQVIVASRCLHFRSMFSSQMREALQVVPLVLVRVLIVTHYQSEITLEDVQATAFSRLLEFLYRFPQ
jgi:hypothetical protein